jgi:hypothetical protein
MLVVSVAVDLAASITWAWISLREKQFGRLRAAHASPWPAVQIRHSDRNATSGSAQGPKHVVPLKRRSATFAGEREATIGDDPCPFEVEVGEETWDGF